jgi:hypothetical protein
MGNCTILDYNLSGKPRHFEIRLKFFRKKEKMISTLAHELVHLKQFAKLELNDSLNKWKGFPVEEEKISYHDLPWEVEAYCIEEVLMRQYLQYKDWILIVSLNENNDGIFIILFHRFDHVLRCHYVIGQEEAAAFIEHIIETYK